MQQPDSRRFTSQAIAASGVLLLTLLAGLSGLWNEFVNWDDPANILDNPHIRGLTKDNLHWMWSARHLGVYEPLSWMLKAAIHSIGGMSAGWFHAVSWLLHGLNAVLAFLLIRELLELSQVAKAPHRNTSSLTAAAALAALFYSVHPLRTECVAWASAQSYLLSAAFSFASLLAYLRAARAAAPGVSWLIVAWLCFVAALLSKTAAVALPAVMLLLDIYPLRRIGGTAGWFNPPSARVWLEKLTFAAPAIACAAFVGASPVISVLSNLHISLAQRLILAGQSLALSLWNTIAPFSLSPFYPLPTTIHWSFVLVLQLTAAITIIALALFAWRRRPALACSAACYLVLLVPTLGLVRHGDQLTADRYTYLAGLPIAVLFAGLLARLGPIAIRVAALLAIGLALLTWRQTSYWHDPESLWKRAIEIDDRNWLAHNNLAAVHLARAEYAAAKPHVERALALQPDYADALLARGILAEQDNRTDDAIAAYRRAIELVPFHAAVVNLAAIYQKSGRRTEAEKLYLDGLAADPTNRDLRNNLATLYVQAGRFDEARPIFAQLLAEGARDRDILLNTGLMLAAASQPADAVKALDAVLKLDAADSVARFHRAASLLALGRRDEAVADYALSIAANPNNAAARAELAVLLLEDGRDADAVEQLDAALKAKPDDMRVLNKLAWVLATSPESAVRDPARALTLATDLARKLNFANAQSLDTLAAAQAANGNYGEAQATADRAIQLARTRGNNALAESIARHRQSYSLARPYIELRVSPIKLPRTTVPAD